VNNEPAASILLWASKSDIEHGGCILDEIDVVITVLGVVCAVDVLSARCVVISQYLAAWVQYGYGVKTTYGVSK
jgi:hypothetical protein